MHSFARQPPSTMFGVDLEEHLQDMRTRVGVDDVPFIIGSAVDFLSGRAASTPGLFRQTVEANEQRQLRAAIESTYVDRRRLDFMVLTSNVHAVGAMLKAYLKELPRPLLCATPPARPADPRSPAAPTSGRRSCIRTSLPRATARCRSSRA